MRPIKDETLDRIEELAIKGADHVEAFLTYDGQDPRFYQRAKLGATAITGLAKLRQAETARMAVELSAHRLSAESPSLTLPRSDTFGASDHENSDRQ